MKTALLIAFAIAWQAQIDRFSFFWSECIEQL